MSVITCKACSTFIDTDYNVEDAYGDYCADCVNETLDEIVETMTLVEPFTGRELAFDEVYEVDHEKLWDLMGAMPYRATLGDYLEETRDVWAVRKGEA